MLSGLINETSIRLGVGTRYLGGMRCGRSGKSWWKTGGISRRILQAIDACK